MDSIHKAIYSEQDLGPVGPNCFSVQQVNRGSKAEQADLQPGDIILEINGENTAGMLNVEAQNKIKSSTQLQLVVDRYADMQICYRNNIMLPWRVVYIVYMSMLHL